MDNKDINVTYETIFELLMREKNREDLQKLDKTFFQNLVVYLKEKQEILDKPNLSIFSEGEREKTSKQIENIKKMLRELYDRREKKIINLALIRSRTDSNIIDLSIMLYEERSLFDCLVDVLNSHRSGILLNLFKARHPELANNREKLDIAKEKSSEQMQKHLQVPETNAEINNPPDPKKRTKFVKFKVSVQKFLDQELNVYGPFSESDTADLPDEVADILINRGNAEEISE